MDVREKAVSYLNSRPRTRQELIRHLNDKGFSENEILETVDELEQYHYIDESCVQRMYFVYGFQKGRGRMADPAGAGRKRRGCRCDRDRIRRTGRDPGRIRDGIFHCGEHRQRDRSERAGVCGEAEAGGEDRQETGGKRIFHGYYP